MPNNDKELEQKFKEAIEDEKTLQTFIRLYAPELPQKLQQCSVIRCRLAAFSNPKKIQNTMNDKKILDATCGSRMMWFDKNNDATVYADKRTENHILCDGRTLEIKPDFEIDFTQMPFESETFSLVVFDPPHLHKLGANSWMAKKYGKLFPGWEDDIKAGFDECMRVLKIDGVLIFKWNENQIGVNKIIEVIGTKPLFGHPSGKFGQTIWMTFMKLKGHTHTAASDIV